MSQSQSRANYRQPSVLNTPIQVTVAKEVAEKLKQMSEFSKIPEGELVNTAMLRFIATHSDYLPREPKKK